MSERLLTRTDHFKLSSTSRRMASDSVYVAIVSGSLVEGFCQSGLRFIGSRLRIDSLPLFFDSFLLAVTELNTSLEIPKMRPGGSGA